MRFRFSSMVLTLATVTLLAGCSVRMKNIADTANEAIFGSPEISLTPQEIAELPYAATYFKADEKPQVVAVMDRATTAQRVFRTAGEEAFITRHGRIIASSGMQGVPLYTSGWENDPLSCYVAQTAQAEPDQDCPQVWQRTVEYGNYGSNELHQVKVRSTFQQSGTQNYQHPDGTPLTVTEIIETGEANGEKFTNRFLAVKGRVVFAKHYLSENLGYGSLSEIKPYTGDL